MTVSVSVTDSAIFTDLRNFLLGILATGTEVIQAQGNRVPEPEGDNFVTMTSIRRPRLSTNVDSSVDAKFTGSIAGALMTISAAFTGAISVGGQIFGVGVADGTVVQSFGSGTGGVGTYNVTPSQNVSSTILSAGSVVSSQATEMVVQLDVHGPASADNAQIISTLFRDQYAVTLLASSGVSPLYLEDPKQVPYMNAEQQYENRYTMDLHLQVNPSVAVPAQYADAANVILVDVTAAYPAS